MKVGILGGGQLAKMLALAALPQGIETLCIDPTPGVCANQVTEVLTGGFDDTALMQHFASQVDVITYESENIPTQTVEQLQDLKPIFPHLDALTVCQDRLYEKQFCAQHDIPTPRFWAVNTKADLEAALNECGYPAVLKTRRFGYDGKGQTRLQNPADINAAWEQLGDRELILEAWINFSRELSCIAARDQAGNIKIYPITENTHIDSILHLSVAPLQSVHALQHQAEAIMTKMLTAFKYVGVLTIEFFQDGAALLINEMAPRVHNSGHWTIEGAATSQFDNHIRAICGRPLGACDAIGYSAMFNAISTLPDTNAILETPYTHWHDYGKSPRPSRKLGHVTLHCPSEATLQNSLNAVQTLQPFNRGKAT